MEYQVSLRLTIQGSVKWAVVSITILRAHKRKGHGAKFLFLISLINSNLVVVLYVDDIDVAHLDMTWNKTH